MARIATVVCTSHSPWLFAQADEWMSGGRERYADGVQRPQVPTDSPEVSNWITAAAVTDGMPGTVVDYVPIYASPIGVAFAYWENV